MAVSQERASGRSLSAANMGWDSSAVFDCLWIRKSKIYSASITMFRTKPILMLSIIVMMQSSANGEIATPFGRITVTNSAGVRRINPSSVTNALGQFSPRSESERELEQMLRGREENIDVGLANWLMVADIPEFRDLTRESYCKSLDTATEQVREEMKRASKVARARGANPDAPDTRCGIFCNAIIKLRFDYRKEFQVDKLNAAQLKALYSDPDNLFLAGLLRTHQGTCLSMPMIYIVIGHRLGVPIYLVTLGSHYWLRWEESGYRMNIEPTIADQVALAPDDGVYLESEGMTRAQLVGSQMRNLSRREVIGQMFFARSGFWGFKGRDSVTLQCLDVSRARHLSPDDPGIVELHEKMFRFYGIRPEHSAIDIRPQPKRKGAN